MDSREIAAKIIDASDAVFYETTKDNECKPCTAIKLVRLKDLVDTLHEQYQEYLEDSTDV